MGRRRTVQTFGRYRFTRAAQKDYICKSCRELIQRFDGYYRNGGIVYHVTCYWDEMRRVQHGH